MSYVRSILLLSAAIALLSGCATKLNYEAFEKNRPRSILVLPPLNNSVEINATAAILSAAVQPLAEYGYYVIPVTNMMEVFRQNGIYEAADIHGISPTKLSEYFGADAVFYMEVLKYGVRYMVIDSIVEVKVRARLVDLRSGEALWAGQVEQAVSTGSGGNPLVALVQAVANQVINTIADQAWPVSQKSMTTLFHGDRGIIPGPYKTAPSATKP